MVSSYVSDLAAGETLRANEKAFLLKASENGWQQMRLAELGVGQAGRSEVRSHAQQLVADYRQLTDALDALVRRKGGIAGAPVGATSESFRKLLENGGPAFDREFVQTAGRLTGAMMTLFEQAAAEAKDADVREFAAAQLPVLRAHSNTAAALKKTL